MTKPPYAKKRRNLNSIVREALGARKFRRHAVAEYFNHDWSKIDGDRQAVVRRLLEITGNKAYLEIGCADNLLFDKVGAEVKVGVDPAKGGTHRMTSDAFFAQNNQVFDVIFIDGLHVYDQVRRDVINALDAVRPGGWIAMHDMFPRDWIEEHTPQISTSRWTGDPWKVAFELIGAEGVEFRLLAIDHGVGVIRVLKESVTLPNRQVELTPQRFAWFRAHFAELPVIDWTEAQAWIASTLEKPAKPKRKPPTPRGKHAIPDKAERSQKVASSRAKRSEAERRPGTQGPRR
ncbi:MAG: class I SAM-dependent methyltransferase [Caulobacteraceae bacterium]